MGEEYLFFGRVGGQFGRREMASPLVESAQTGGRIRPIYPQTQGLSTRVIEGCVASALAMRRSLLEDPLPDVLRQEQGLCHVRFALKTIHFQQMSKRFCRRAGGWYLRNCSPCKLACYA